MFQRVNHLAAAHNHVIGLQQREINHVNDSVRALHIRPMHLDPAAVEHDRVSCVEKWKEGNDRSRNGEYKFNRSSDEAVKLTNRWVARKQHRQTEHKLRHSTGRSIINIGDGRQAGNRRQIVSWIANGNVVVKLVGNTKIASDLHINCICTSNELHAKATEN